MHGPDHLGALFAYGPAPGMELIPYFLGLLAWMGLAVAAMFWAPIAAVWRRIRGSRAAKPPESSSAQTTAVQTSGENNRDGL